MDSPNNLSSSQRFKDFKLRMVFDIGILPEQITSQFLLYLMNYNGVDKLKYLELSKNMLSQGPV